MLYFITQMIKLEGKKKGQNVTFVSERMTKMLHKIKLNVKLYNFVK